MVHIITGSCCNDATCISACPVNCISPTPDSPDFLTAGMLHINPDSCIDCGACADVCPVAAIIPAELAVGAQTDFIEINKNYFIRNPFPKTTYQKKHIPLNYELQSHLKVAIVGSGPSAMYLVKAMHLSGVKHISVFEKANTIGGLVYSGVAPDKNYTKQMLDLIKRTFKDTRVNLFLNVDVGTDISQNDILASHHAIIYATGTKTDKTLKVKGAQLKRSYGIREFSGWYNGVSEFRLAIDELKGPRAIIVGHGNTALDAARFLISGTDYLNHISISQEIKNKLVKSNINEVILLGRPNLNGPAFTIPTLHEIYAIPGIELVLDTNSIIPNFKQNPALEWILANAVKENISFNTNFTSPKKRVIIKFNTTVTEILGSKEVVGVKILNQQENNFIPAQTVIRAIGYQNIPITGLPFDDSNNKVPNHQGAVLVSGKEAAGIYVAGWLKRGPIGGIGHNEPCSTQTVNKMIEHANAGLLTNPSVSINSLASHLEQTHPFVRIIRSNNINSMLYSEN